MAIKKGPGVRPLGYGPAGKEKLEGPKVHHDYHGMTDSVPGKGKGMAVPSGHWEKQYNPLPHGNDHGGKAFDPRIASDRPCTHNKVNMDDH
jgi:hypothetical protein